MKHILDYNLLQEWGFKWAMKGKLNGEEHAIWYMLTNKFYSEANYFKPVMIQLVPHPLFMFQWMIFYYEEGKETKPTDVIFRGIIKNRDYLECILQSVIVYKPNKKVEDKKEKAENPK